MGRRGGMAGRAGGAGGAGRAGEGKTGGLRFTTHNGQSRRREANRTRGLRQATASIVFRTKPASGAPTPFNSAFNSARVSVEM
jgi:hypothetical protein